MTTAIKLTPVSIDPVESAPLKRHVRVLLVKPYQPTLTITESPPMGLICLSASLKEAFRSDVTVKVLDMKLYKQLPEHIRTEIRAFHPDIIGVSALNCEAVAAREIAAIAKSCDDQIITVLGGPYAHLRSREILNQSRFDWIVDGPGDRVFTRAIRRHINGQPLGTDIPGLAYRLPSQQYHISEQQDLIEDLDSLPMPDWSLIDFDEYSRRMTMLTMQKGKRYALLFTSRGCPYLCNYCHDIFGKRFKFQSAERVIKEIEYLYETHGVNEFQIIDDIFNLHKPRLKQVMHEVNRRWPGKIHFSFPNGVRADILDEEVLDDLKLGGTYAMCVAIETATPRLQTMVEKHLDIEKTKWVIEQADKRGIVVIGFFMLGFPTETPEELQATANFALNSKLTLAHMFTVIPQPGTPLYPLAEQENGKALRATTADDEHGRLSYRGEKGAATWYERTYGFPLSRFVSRANTKFYFTPSRIWRIARGIPPKSILQNIGYVLLMKIRKGLTFLSAQNRRYTVSTDA